MLSLKHAIKKAVLLSAKDIDVVVSLFKPVTLAKKEFFLKVGDRCDHAAFINSGMVRIFYTNVNGEETTCYFALPNEFVTSFSSFITGNISTENIQAILPTELYVISKHDLEMLYKTIPATQELGRKAAEDVALSMEKRMSLFLNNSAEERYQFLVKNNPLLIQKVPLQYLASFLGITPQHLSRLRKNI